MKHWSIRFKITALFAASLVLIVLVTFFLVRLISGSVLSGTARDYLLASVDANVDVVAFVKNETEGEGEEFSGNDIRIEYQGGFLVIDEDFLDVINNVYTALYTGEGVLLYGMNPIARQMEGDAFTGNRVRRMTVENTRYEIYERRIPVEGTEDLWLRGVMDMTTQTEQLRAITNISEVLLPALVLLAVLFAHLTAGRMLKPLGEIERTAAEISGGTDLNRRIMMSGPDDEIHRLADTFDGMVERLNRSFETERQFTSDASHELRTPMSVILAQCEYTLDRERTVPEYVEAIRTIRRQGARMNGLINDMLDVTRMEQRAERYPLTRINLSELVKNVCADMAMIKENGISLQSQITGRILIQGNQMLMTRLLQNLINNAYRYGKADGSIEVSLTQDETGEARLAVKDDGVGIEKEDLPHIFERFYRADAARSGKGTGLGLSMVKRIAELHHAEVLVESTPGEGTTFTVRIPVLSNREE